MRWTQQVVHVARKDLRQCRWQLLVYALVVAMATMAGADLLGRGWVAVSTLLVVCAGLLAVATLIHADPPERIAAEWAVWPLDWSAVLAAKCLLAVAILIGTGVAGQAVVLVAFDVAINQMPPLLGSSILTYAAWLSFGGMLAILTRSVRGFLLTLLLLLAASQFIAIAFMMFADEIVPAPALPIWFTAVGVLILIWQYRSYSRWRGAAAVSLVVLVPMVLLALLPAPRHPFTGPPTVPLELRQEVRMTRSGVGSDDRIVLAVTVDTAAPGHRYMLRDARVTLHTSDGTRRELASISTGSLNTAQLVMNGEPILSVGRDAVPGGLNIEVPRDQAVALERGNAWLEVAARVEVQQSHVIEIAPLVKGSTRAARGLRLKIVEIYRPELQMTVETASIRPADPGHAGPAFSPGPHILALVNVTRSPIEGMTLHRRSGGGGSLGAVIPGVPLERWSGVYGADPFGTWDSDASSEWMGEASLLIGEWVSLGSYPVNVAVRPEPGGRSAAAM